MIVSICSWKLAGSIGTEGVVVVGPPILWELDGRLGVDDTSVGSTHVGSGILLPAALVVLAGVGFGSWLILNENRVVGPGKGELRILSRGYVDQQGTRSVRRLRAAKFE